MSDIVMSGWIIDITKTSHTKCFDRKASKEEEEDNNKAVVQTNDRYIYIEDTLWMRVRLNHFNFHSNKLE